MNLWDILSGAGYVLDTPGALTRGAIGNIGDLVSGKNRTKGARATGREMLESLGILGPNREGFDAGDVVGGVADLVVDPVNVLSGYGAWKGAKAVGRMLKGRKAADPITSAMESGSRALVPVKQVANPIEEAVGMATKAAAAPNSPFPKTPDVIPLPGPVAAVAKKTARPKPTLEVNTKVAERFAKEFRKGEITAEEAEAAIRNDLGREVVKNRMALHKWHERYTKSDDWEDIWDNEVDAVVNEARENLVQLFRQMIEKGRRT
jgi:hypothetical protein